ncbi:MAG: acetolactate synthase small subunit [Clostridia bacterium]|nr:acetolactate synthase small subunit [Clostridia bacterium]
MNNEKQHVILSVLVSNHFGVLMRVSSLFTRRGYNIDSLTVGETNNPEFSRMTITTTVDESTKEQIVKQLSKIYDVKKIEVMVKENTIEKELMLIKISITNDTRTEIMNAINLYMGKIVDLTPNTITIEITAEQSKLNDFVKYLEPYGIIELCRTGITAIGRGSDEILSPS